MANTNEVHINGFAATDGSRNGKGPLRFRLGHGGGKKKDRSGYWPTHFFNVVCWESDPPAIVKGAEVEVKGRLSTSTWEKNGEKRTAVEIVATEINLAALKQKKAADAL